MRDYKRMLRLYMPFARSTIQTMLSYRLNFFMFVIGDILKIFVSFYLWQAVYKNSPASVINGFTSGDMIIYIFISSITAGLIGWNTDGVVGNEVKDGSIAANLIKPISYRLRLFFAGLGGVAYQGVFIALPAWLLLVAISFFTGGKLPPDIFTILAYLVSVILALIVTFLFDFCFGLLAFYITNLWGATQMKYVVLSFLSGQLIPIVFFPEWVQKCMNFIPAASMNYIPVMVYLKKLSGASLLQGLAVQFAWVVILYALSEWMWHRATKRLTILGG